MNFLKLIFWSCQTTQIENKGGWCKLEPKWCMDKPQVNTNPQDSSNPNDTPPG
jgi:hypothetical protein